MTMRLSEANNIMVDKLPMERRVFVYEIEHGDLSITESIAREVCGQGRFFQKDIVVKGREVKFSLPQPASEYMEKAIVLLPALNVLSWAGYREARYNGMIMFRGNGTQGGYRDVVILLTNCVTEGMTLADLPYINGVVVSYYPLSNINYSSARAYRLVYEEQDYEKVLAEISEQRDAFAKIGYFNR